jgi:dipeptidyl-peptidase 4
MKTLYKNLAIVVALTTLSFSVSLKAQMPFFDSGQPRILGWADDTHYLLQTIDETKHKIIKNVNIVTGKSVVLSDYQSEMDILKASLPAGFAMGMGDEISDDKKVVVITRNNDLWYYKTGESSAKQLTQDSFEEKNPRLSPDGLKVAYTKNRDLYVYDVNAGKEIRLTSDANDYIYNGWASWVYCEEILGRSSKNAAFWWSPDSKKVAYLHTDDSPVPEYTLNELKSSDGPRGRIEIAHYPKAGDPNPKVKMGVADISTGATVWVKTDESVDQYIAWPVWTPDSRKLMVQVLNRDQNDMRFILADITSGDYSEIYNERRKTWVEFFEDIYVMNDGSGFILRSYKSDWFNLYYYSWDGSLKSQITNLNWNVNEIVKVDEADKVVYFKGTGPESTDSHFFRVGIDGKNLLQITTGAGTHNVNMSPKGSYFLDNYSSVSDAGGIYAIDKKAKPAGTVYKNTAAVLDGSKNSRTELVKIKTSDGLFNLPALITYPLNYNPEIKYPVVFNVYGGPDAGSVRNRWNGNKADWFAQNGIITINVDHRGSGHFGKKGSDYMYRSLGKWEISDYSDVVRWLWEKSWVDKNRIGITGGSYGGYISCMALTKGAEFWNYGIADFSVTDWRLYDNIYTERFMDTPLDNPDGYKEASALTYASSYKGKLLIRHGDMDDNVHLQNSLWFISILQDLNKPFELMIYPGERHGWGGPKRAFYQEESDRFWLKSFFGK